MAYLAVSSWATAYAYGWGQAVYHGYPWWHVVQGGSMIARSLAYVCATSLILVIGYLLGYFILKWSCRCLGHVLSYCPLFGKPSCLHPTQNLGFLKIFILLTVFSAPIAFLLYFYVGILSCYRLFVYLLVLIALSLILNKTGKSLTFSINLKELTSNEHYYQVFMGFIFVYLVVLAFVVGYLRSAFFMGHDIIKLDNRPYYILAANGDDDLILGEHTKNNHEFVFYNRKTLNFYRIYITPSPYLPKPNLEQ